MGLISWLFGSKPKQPEVQQSESKRSSYTPLQKYYAFNETGNVMVCTTHEGADTMNENLKSMFLDMSIFFAAMTKAITTHNVKIGQADEAKNETMKKDEKKTPPVSIYSFNSLQNILNKSEFFVQMKKESVLVSSKSVGDSMGKELTESLLGRKFDETRLNFTSGVFNSMSDHLANEHSEGAAGTIFFICESIMGLPMVSAVVLELNSVDGKGKKDGKEIEGTKTISDLLKMEEGRKSKGIHREWEFTKHTYMFISPKSISGVNFPDPGDDLEYQTLVSSLKNSLAVQSKSDSKKVA